MITQLRRETARRARRISSIRPPGDPSGLPGMSPRSRSFSAISASNAFFRLNEGRRELITRRSARKPASQPPAPDHQAMRQRSDTGAGSPWKHQDIGLFSGSTGSCTEHRSGLRRPRETTEKNRAQPNRKGSSTEVSAHAQPRLPYQACRHHKLSTRKHIPVDRARPACGIRAPHHRVPVAETGAPSTVVSNVPQQASDRGLLTTSRPPCPPPVGRNCSSRCSN